MNYYEHHLGDYMRDTAHLSMIEDAAYHRLLAAYYIREKPLPVDRRECQKLARAVSKAERDAVDYVLKEFFDIQEDGHHQHRADREIARFQDKQRKAKASAEARWSQRETHSDGNANAMRTHEAEIQGNGKEFDVAMQNNISCAPRQNSGESQNLSIESSNINNLNHANAMRTHSEGICEGNATRARPQSPDTSNHKNQELKPTRQARSSPSARVEVSEGEMQKTGISQELAVEFLRYRRAKRAPLTPAAWRTIVSEIEKSGMGVEGGLSQAMARGWQGFESSWMAGKNGSNQPVDLSIFKD